MTTNAPPTNRAKMPDEPRRNTRLPASNTGSEEALTEGNADSLAAAVSACQAGDRAAQRQVFDACHESVYRLAVRMVGLQDAADVTQQAFLQAFRSIGQYRGESRFTTWLYRLAVNESLQHLRRDRRSRHVPLEREPVDSARHEQNEERKELLDKALSDIDPELRSIFLLREVEELSYREIAEALQIPAGTVGSRLNRARRELQKRLSDLGWDE